MAAGSHQIRPQQRSQHVDRLGQLSPQIVQPSSSRRPHLDGDIPPELSPLDAFALQGFLLSKQLDQPSKDGKRMSRLPPTTIASSLAQVRPGYLRSVSADPPRAGAPTDIVEESSSGSLKGELEVPDQRPISVYPRMSNVPSLDCSNDAQPRTQLLSARRRSSERLSRLNEQSGLAPHPIYRNARTPEPERDMAMRPKRSFDVQRSMLNHRDTSVDSNKSPQYQSRNLAPPGSPKSRQASSIRSVPPDSSDDDGGSSLGGSFISVSKSPSSSNMTLGRQSPPLFPYNPPPRSPSVSSEYSVNNGKASRTAFNFSRPISRASRPSFESSLQRQESADSQRSLFTDEVIQTPPLSTSNDHPAEALDPSAPSTYIYSRFSLPRGRALKRGSILLTEDKDILTPSRSQSNVSQEQPTSPPVRRAELTSASSPESQQKHSPRNAMPLADESLPRTSANPTNRPITPQSPETRLGQQAGSSPFSDTLRPPDVKPKAISAEISVEEHLAKGIESHEKGSLKESTYHLRIAAKQNHPTAMLLYALACRHGWGMRPNQKEGVEWLRKAADCASLEVADDEDLLKEGISGDYNERKTRRAQFALSIYELGVSHMNGWGIEQDKTLALRCFEIASSWGDGDAMTETGFCYAQGVGCKKDLKKAAHYYRMAESKGVSMVGNSWIYKSKYNEDNGRSGRSRSATVDGKGKPRDKSRTRTIFGRKKSTAS